MTAAMNAQRMVTRVWEKIENRSGATWDASKTLEAIDESIQSLVIMQQEAYQGYEQDYVDLTVLTEKTAGRMVQGIQDILEWRVPEYIHKVRRIEDTTNGDLPNEIPFTDLMKKEQMRDFRQKAGQHHWFFSRRSMLLQQVGFIGSLTGVTSIRVWYIRRVAPLHFYTPTAITTNAQDGSVVATTTLTVLSTTNLRAGMVVRIGRGTVRVEDRTIQTVLTATTVQLTTALGFTHTTVQNDTVEPLNAFIFQATIPASSTAPPTSGGRVVSRDDLYIGATIEITNDVTSPTTLAGNLDTLLQVTAYYGYPRIAMFHTSLTAPVTSATTYAMVPQIEPEHHELVVVWAAVRLAEESGSQKMIGTLSGKLGKLMQDFQNGIENRQHQTPSFVWHYPEDSEI